MLDPARARQAIAIVAPLLGNPLVNAGMQRAPIVIWTLLVMRLDCDPMKDVHEAAVARLEDAAKHDDERVREAAARAIQWLQTLKKI